MRIYDIIYMHLILLFFIVEKRNIMKKKEQSKKNRRLDSHRIALKKGECQRANGTIIIVIQLVMERHTLSMRKLLRI